MASLTLRGSFMLAAAAACWGIGTVLSKQALGGVPPLALLPIQLLVSCGVLLVAARALRMQFQWSGNLGRLGLLGILNPGLAYTLGLLGLTYISASMSVLLWALEPAFILVLAHLFLHDVVGQKVGLAIGAAVCGVLLVVYQPGTSGSLLGVLLVLSAVALCAIYTVAARGLLVDDESLLVVIVQQVVALGFAASVLLIAHALYHESVGLDGLDAGTLAAATVSGALYYGIAFWLYLAGLRQTSATVAGSFLTLIPVFGLAGGLVIGETLSTRQWFGAAVVVIAIALVAYLQLPRARAADR
jgi:probable blue pigment (indigoidine) exporter